MLWCDTPEVEGLFIPLYDEDIQVSNIPSFDEELFDEDIQVLIFLNPFLNETLTVGHTNHNLQ